ncbi:MAG: FAD-binding oxidoreductase [Gammaproteobacteria bacterium]|nr:FAD-binding oxidoreductase [Gammaproteobacteria bacterium]
MSEKHEALYRELKQLIPVERLVRDPLRTLAYGTDASFYRLIPQLVVKVENETEVVALLGLADRHLTPVTFRAAGTSLSGQAISDSVLAVLGNGWKDVEISGDAGEVRLQPGVIGATANARLAPFNRKIGPDPASINAAKIGGIAANNASGMCCGTAQNSYRTLAGMRIVFADGSVLNTRDEESCEAFSLSHGPLLKTIADLAATVKSNPGLSEKIRHKYRLKNTTGYSLNALLDFESPIDIIQHLMIGSEGTLGFISDISYHTVPDHPHKATALMLFPDIETACQAVARLKSSPVDAVELMDPAALGSVRAKPGMPVYLEDLDEEVSALLVETRADSPESLHRQVEQIGGVLSGVQTVRPIAFSHDKLECESFWNIRKGLFPAVGAVRITGTTVIIEDVAFPVPELANAVRDLQALFRQYEYHEALIFGHALEGNLHFVFTQDFDSPKEVERYRGLMESVCDLVVNKYQGSLKAEHGTGRNMAPFVEMEWGSDAYDLMRQIKQALDPAGLLNPGVVLNDNPTVYLENLKPLPPTSDIVDKCIECGFCEAVCPSRDLTLTPRQRIVINREVSRLQKTGSEPERLSQLLQDYQYQALDTCAADGMCATRCPVSIDTGVLTKAKRAERITDSQKKLGGWVSDHFSGVSGITRLGLGVASGSQALLGNRLMGKLTGAVRQISGERIPLWNHSMPGPAQSLTEPANMGESAPRVVYFPSCASRMMGPARVDPERRSLHRVTLSLLEKAGYQVIFPPSLDGMCCGMPFDSKGLKEQGVSMIKELERVLLEASREGEYPVLCDTSPCTLRLQEHIGPGVEIHEPIGFTQAHLLPRLKLNKLAGTIALHTTCSSHKMGLNGALKALGEACAEWVVVPEDISCCGFAGDRGFNFPELNASALGELGKAIPEDCEAGYSNSRTCEIGLSLHAGIPYRSILYLVDQCSVPR